LFDTVSFGEGMLDVRHRPMGRLFYCLLLVLLMWMMVDLQRAEAVRTLPASLTALSSD